MWWTIKSAVPNSWLIRIIFLSKISMSGWYLCMCWNWRAKIAFNWIEFHERYRCLISDVAEPLNVNIDA